MSCATCGAVLDPAAVKCPYCNAPTQAGVLASQRAAEQAHLNAQWQVAAQFQNEAQARARVEGLGKQAMIWSVVGTALCCLPLGVVGVVQASRARSFAAQARVPVPTSAKAAFWVGILSGILSVGFVTWALLRSDRLEDRAQERIEQLGRDTRAGAAAATLDTQTACGLAEMHALKTGYGGESGRELDGFECPGRVTASGDRAALTLFRFHYQSSKTFETHVCFERGTSWFVREIRKDACAVEGERKR